MRRKALALASLFTLFHTAVYSQENVTEKTANPESYSIMEYSEPRPYIINSIKLTGAEFLDERIVIASTGLQVGEVIYIPGSAITEAITRLWNQRYFADVNIVAEFEGTSVNLEILVQERPRVYNWNFEGIRKGQASTLLEEMKLKRGTELSDNVLNKNINHIKKYFSDKGFRNTEVTPRIENDSLMQNAVNVTFVVDRNARVKIGEINFEGNEEFTDKRLRRTMKKTNQVGINIFKSFKLKEKDYEEDKVNLIDFYNSQGYRNMAILNDTIYPINEKRIGIDIEVEEGHIYYIRNVSWVGNTVYTTEALNKMFGVAEGDHYDKKTIDKRLGIGMEVNMDDPTQISALYQNNGYLASTIEPAEIVVGRDSIDLEIRVMEGKQYTIRNVNITGNMRVNDEVIRREVRTVPGDLFNRSLLMETMRQLGQMKHFDPAGSIPNYNPVGSEHVDITWPLTETASDQLEISGGWGMNMFVGSLGVTLNNVAIGDFFKKGAWRPYPQGQNQQLSLRAQTNGKYYTAVSGSFTEPWLGGKKPNSLTISAHYSSQTDSYYGTKPTKYFRTSSIAAGLGRRLKWPDYNFLIYNEVGYQRYNLYDWGYGDSPNSSHFIFRTGKSNVFSLKTVISRNSVNNMIYPQFGSDFSLAITLTPPYSLFDNKDYKTMYEYTTRYNNNYANGITPTDEETKLYNDYNDSRYKFIEYHKWVAKMTWYFPLTTNQKLVLMTKAELGYLGHYNEYKKSPFEGFDLGGDGMSGYSYYGMDIVPLRGYEDGTLTPTYGSANQDYAKAYNKYTVELRYPIIMQPSSYIYALVFAEGGNAYMSWKEFDPFKLKRSLGAGIRLYLPIVGMIGVDWGYGFDVPVGSTTRNGGKVHFMMGMQF